ncbi:MAG: hypothetical protein ABSG33_10275 [Candidatus Bathyarchaeia archaeon]
MKICECCPERVHEQNNIHYFYWRWDLYKKLDYEPVFVYSNGKRKTVISRFHWNLATVWTQPVEEDGLPIVDFVGGVHTPIVMSQSIDIRYFEIAPDISTLERLKIIELYVPTFKAVLTSVKFGARQSYEHLIVAGGVPPKFVFDLNKVKYCLSIGTLPEPDDLPPVLRNKLWPT